MPEKPVSVARVFLGYLADIVLPLALYFVLHHFGVPDVVSLFIGTAVAIFTTVVNTIRRGKLDRVGVIVLFEVVTSIVLLFTLHDPRLLLIKPSFYTGIAGIYLIATSFHGRPINYEAVKHIGTGGEPVRAEAFDKSWDENPALRRTLRISSAGWGVACLADAILRAVIVFQFPLDRAVWLSNIPHFAAIAILIAFSAAMGRKTKSIVDAKVAQMKSAASA